jgi:Flp pilus assembly protein TadG
MKTHKKEEAGSVLIAFALFLFVLLGFCALGMEAGRWYMVRAELSKSVDAAALAAARNISNPFVTPRTLAEEFAAANFPSGYLGTPGSGNGRVTFTATMIGSDKVQVDGNVSATAILSRLFGANLVPTSSRGVAQQKEVEIMMVLDRSGSMAGAPIASLKTAATNFVTLFTDTQTKDKLGLITFATSVTSGRPLGTNYVSPVTAAIRQMDAEGATNSEDAVDQADGPTGFTDQTGLPGDRRVQQFMIFFSDGRPTAFRGSFRRGASTHDAVACVTGNCERNDGGVTYTDLGRPNVEQWMNLSPRNTGNGINSVRCFNQDHPEQTTRWYIFNTNPVPDRYGDYYPPTANCIPDPDLHDHICTLATDMAMAHATELKAKYIKIYTIGLGSNVNETLMRRLATDESMYYHAPTEEDLQAIFQKVAQEIKLRLVQ